MITFTNKIAIVTGAGATQGIGYATCKALASVGAQVFALDISFDHQPENWAALTCDVSNHDQCVSTLNQIASTEGRVDILVNSAGIVAPTRLSDLSPEEFQRMLNINAQGVFNVTKAALPYLKSEGGSIVNIASIAAQRGGGLLGGSHYAASKGAVTSFTKACARELGQFGIRSNCVNPGIIETPMTHGKYPEDRLKSLLPQIPLGRLGLAREVANAIVYLSSDLASYITGAELDVNGGYHIH